MKEYLSFLTLFIILISGCGLPSYQELSKQESIQKNVSLPAEDVLTASAAALREQGFYVTKKRGEIWAKRPETWTSYPVKIVVRATPQGDNNSLVRISGKRASLLFSADGCVENVLKKLSRLEQARLRRELPAELVTNVTFSDKDALFPNQALNASERAKLTVTVRNNGKGIGFNVKLKVNSDNPYVTVEEAKSLGDLAPGEEGTITISIETSLQAKDGFASILVETKEKRGFDAQKQQIRIPIVHLDAPQLEITSVELNDRKLGRAQGNGNGIPENDETIELIAFIKNSGVGDAINAKLELVEINSGLSVLERAMDLGTIRPNQTVKGTLLFHAPRKFSAEQLKYQLRVSELRGVGTAEKTETIAMGFRQPVLAYLIKSPDVLHNGEQASFELIPQNQGSLDARGVSIRLSAPGASIMPETFEIVDIPANTDGLARQFVVDLPRTYSQKQLTLNIQLTQSDFPGKTGEESYPVELLTPQLIVADDRFIEQNHNQLIEQGERVEVELTLTNRGRLEAQNVRVSVSTSIPDVQISQSQRLVGTLPPNTTSNPIKFIFTLPRAGKTGDFPIIVTINQADFKSVIHQLNYTIAEAMPVLGVTAQFVDENKDGRIKQGEKVDVSVTITNTGKQDALNAKVQLSTNTPNVKITKATKSIGTLSPNKSVTVTFPVTVPFGAGAGTFPLEVKVTHAEFAPAIKTLNYTIYEAGAATTVVEAKKTPEQPSPPVIGNNPPTIQPTNVKNNQTLYSANFELQVSVSDDRGLVSVTAKLNGAPVYDSQRDQKAMEQLKSFERRMMSFSQPLTLQQGDNVVVISAEDSNSEREEITLHLKYNPRASVISQISDPSDVDVDVPKGRMPQQNGVALVIGIEKYQHISDALYADRDAIAFRQYLIDLFGFKKENIVLLTNEEATLANIKKGLRQLSDWSEPTSDVIVYYAGHGLPTPDGKQQFLIPYDGDQNYLDDTGYALSAFYKRLSQLKPKSVTMFMDACFSGADREDNSIVDARPIFQVIEGPGAYKNLEVFASSTGSQLSASFPDKRHGMFTYYLLKGLRGEADLDKDGAIKLTEMEKFVQENVSRKAKRKGKDQTPTLMGQKKERILAYPVQR